MSRAHKSLALIPARGGSKGLPGKNIVSAGGKPLIAWTIEAARQARCIDRLILSSDDPQIMEVARLHQCEVPFTRPAHLATDTASSADVVLHALEQVPGYDYVILLQPTSPLRSAQDIDAAFELLMESGGSACVSVCLSEVSPYWMFMRGGDAILSPFLNGKYSRRQDLPPAYVLNGAIYIAKADDFRRHQSFIGKETLGYVMPASRSLDIDDRDDLDQFQRMLGAQD